MAADPRFYEALGPLTAAEIARTIAGDLHGPGDLSVKAIAAPASAGPGDLFFLTDTRSMDALEISGAAILVPDAEAGRRATGRGNAAIVTASPKAALARIATRLVRARQHEGEALISSEAEIASGALIAPGAIIGPGAKIAEDAQIGAGAVIGPGVEIGKGTRVGPRVAISFAIVGSNCDISAGAVIGETGFGLAYENGEMLTLPHVGRVIIEDDVTLGANVTIDRGMFEDTRLKRGCRIDNLSHIAHNTVVGEYAVMAAFAGISGSVTIGAGVQFGGRVGVADHLSIGDQARLAADSAVMRDVPAGETWAGSPAQPIRQFMRETAWLRRESGRGRSGGKGS